MAVRQETYTTTRFLMALSKPFGHGFKYIEIGKGISKLMDTVRKEEIVIIKINIIIRRNPSLRISLSL